MEASDDLGRRASRAERVKMERRMVVTVAVTGKTVRMKSMSISCSIQARAVAGGSGAR